MLGFQQTKKSSQISNINVEEGANLYKSDRTKNYLQKPIHSSKHMTTSWNVHSMVLAFLVHIKN